MSIILYCILLYYINIKYVCNDKIENLRNILYRFFFFNCLKIGVIDIFFL